MSGTLAVVVVGLVGIRKVIGQALGTAVEEVVVDKGKAIDQARGTAAAAAARPLQGILRLTKRRKKEQEASACCWGYS